MADTNIDNYGSQSGVYPTIPLTGISAPSGTTIIPTDNSTISASDAVALSRPWDASFPILLPPGMQIELRTHDIIIGMLDGWLADLAAQKERIEKEINSPAYQQWLESQKSATIARENAQKSDAVEQAALTSPMYLQWLASQFSSEQIRMDQLQRTYNAISSIEGGVTNYLNNSGNTAAALGLVSLMAQPGIVIDTTVTGNLITPTSLPYNTDITSQVFQSAWQNIGAVGMPENASAILGLIGAMFAVPLFNLNAADSVDNSMRRGEPVSDVTVAKDYAKNMLALVKSNELDRLIMTLLVGQTENGQPISQGRKEELTAMFKIVLLATAAALLYKHEIGGWKVSPQEFRDLVLGNLNLPEGDIRRDLIAAIRTELSKVRPSEQNRILDAIAAFLGTNPSAETLMKPARVYQGVWQNIDRPISDA